MEEQPNWPVKETDSLLLPCPAPSQSAADCYSNQFLELYYLCLLADALLPPPSIHLPPLPFASNPLIPLTSNLFSCSFVSLF